MNTTRHLLVIEYEEHPTIVTMWEWVVRETVTRKHLKRHMYQESTSWASIAVRPGSPPGTPNTSPWQWIEHEYADGPTADLHDRYDVYELTQAELFAIRLNATKV